MKQFLLLLFCCGIVSSAQAQKTQKIALDSQDPSGEAYMAVFPESAPTALLVLVGSYGETPEEVLVNTKIPTEASKKGILTIIPVFTTGIGSIGFDDATQNSFQKIVDFAIEKHQLQKKPFFAGGFSIGGTAVVKFTELAQQKENCLTAIFAVDPPLDMERLYKSAKRNLRLSINSEPSRESVFLIKRLEQEFGGSPNEFPKKYYAASPYSFSDTTQNAIKPLILTPIRIYTEPDLDFFSSKGMDLYAVNAFDASAFLNELQRLGNQQSRLIISHNKGYREPGHEKNPHSWSIVDAEELIDWLLQQK